MELSDQFTPISAEGIAAATAAVNKPEGGFSVRAYGPNAGEAAKDAYMVGGQGGTLRITDGPATEAQGARFVAQQREALTRKDHFWGGWNAGKHIDYDVSAALPRTSGGLSKARGMAVHGNEMAIGELGHKGEYDEHTNPFHGQELSAASRSHQYEPIRSRRRRS